MKAINQSNIQSIKNSETIINISDMLIVDLKERKEYLKRVFNYTINYLLDNTNITFNEVRNIVKYFNLNKYEVVISFLNDLRKERINYIKSFYF
ncbi:MAG: hypothetical protein IKG40_01345 [Bacilli bacterium]|nr:hypothetical protein [Bacilli bacterium]